jgi:hypothetical protein
VKSAPGIASLALAMLALSAAASGGGSAVSVRRVDCSLPALVARARSGSGSAAYRHYLAAQLRELAATWPEQELIDLFDAESDPELVELLGAALAGASDRELDASGLHAVANRAEEDPDPALRAAAVRALRRTTALENTQDLYTCLVQDPSPEVRQEAATNLVEDNRLIYSGHDGPAADAAVAAAVATDDPEIAAQIVAGISTEAVSAPSASGLVGLLGSGEPRLRAAAAGALGGVPASERDAARAALLELFDRDTDLEVREAIVEAVVRLDFAGARPLLARLRVADPRLAGEIDAWTAALALGLQEWSLIVREKQRLTAKQ